MSFPLKDPTPDFSEMIRVLKGESKPQRVHFVEEFVDPEIVDYITQNIFHIDLPPLGENIVGMGNVAHFRKKIRKFLETGKFSLLDGELDKLRIKRDISFYFRMGFDYLPDLVPYRVITSLVVAKAQQKGSIAPGARQGKDGDAFGLPRNVRNYQEESVSLVRSWQDFNNIPWGTLVSEAIETDSYFEFMQENLPQGMKIPIVGSTFDPGVIGVFFGYEDFCTFLYEKPDLVKAVIDGYGQMQYELYKRIIPLECVGFLWHADDLGFKQQTLVSPEFIRENIIPWYKKFADLAHDNGKLAWFHSCGNVYDLMENFIIDVGFDAKHSFEDEILPVTRFQELYGKRIATLGGVDVDKLCRLQEQDLRAYCRNILDQCMSKGRYAFGTGNSVANYIPIGNYLAMMEEGYSYLR